MGIPVLVIDPNVDNGKRIKETMEGDHLFQVTVATRAIEALMRFTETRFRVAIVDFGLPDLNGADLIRQMRGIDENIVVVAILKNKESHTREIERLAVNIVLDQSDSLNDLPRKIAQLLKLHSVKSSSAKAANDSSGMEAQPQPNESKQEKTIQQDAAQNKGFVKEANQAKPLQEEVSKDEKVHEGDHPGKAHLEEIRPTEVRQEKPIESVQNEQAPEELPEKEDLHLQTPQIEPAQSCENQDGVPKAVPPWLKESAAVEQYLASLQQEHSAYATLLSLGNTPWTYSDQLTESQAHGIVRLLSEHDEGLQSKGALIRYIRLSGTGNDYLLYAMPVVGNINLSMIFGMDTPFSVARRQTHRLRQLLAEQDPRKVSTAEKNQVMEKLISVSQEEDELLLPSEWIPGPTITTSKEESPQPVVTLAQAEEPQKEKEMPPSFTNVSDIVPIPDDWLPKEPKPSSHLPFLEQETAQPEKTIELEPVNLVQQEPKYNLPFTAILLPRFPNHRLTGSLANQLENWLKDLCIAWGWRLDRIELRSEFLRFTVSLSPDIAPAQAVQNLANNLSSRILNAFPALTKDLPSGQFWTKSYLLTAGSDVGKDRLAAFVETTRKEQGLVN
jgi:CheY-like chemotaxis protein